MRAWGQRPWQAGRRAWLAGAALACARSLAGADIAADPEQSAIAAQAEKAGLGPFRMSRTANYVGIGDAVDIFRTRTLADCEAVRSDYMDFYRARGFEIAAPAQPLTVVTLTDDRSFAAFLGKREYALAREGFFHGPTVHGVYQPRSNRLVVFDHRSLGRQTVPLGGVENLRALAHEATHQLTYNTGLLDRQGDVPLCISEGLAMYGEPRRPVGRTPPGEPNGVRLRDLSLTRFGQISWTPVADLLSDDRRLRGPGPLQALLLGYAQSWLLVHYLMSEPASRVGFRLYLKALRGRQSRDNRLDDARTHLGDLDQLNRELQEYAERLRRSRSELELNKG